MMPTLNNLLNQFQTAGQHYSTTLQPIALHLFFVFFGLEVTISFIQYCAEGQLDPVYFLGRLFRHILGGGFTYLMILHSWTWMGYVIQSFSQIGANISGVGLDPDAILRAGVNLADTLTNTPIGTGFVSSIELAFVAAAIAIIVVIAFAAAALEMFFTLVFAYLGIGVGIILLAFGALRFTATTAEGYFKNVLQTGVKILFIYAVLGIGLQMVTSWNTALAAACHPVVKNVWSYPDPFSVPIYASVTACTGTIALRDMFDYLAMALIFAASMIGVPRMAANLVGGIAGHALEHAAAAYYIGRSVGSAGGGALGTAGKVGGAVSSTSGNSSWVGSPAQKQFAGSTAAQAQNTQPALNPFAGLKPGQKPGYNLHEAPTQALASDKPTRAGTPPSGNGNGTP